MHLLINDQAANSGRGMRKTNGGPPPNLPSPMASVMKCTFLPPKNILASQIFVQLVPTRLQADIWELCNSGVIYLEGTDARETSTSTRGSSHPVWAWPTH